MVTILLPDTRQTNIEQDKAVIDDKQLDIELYQQ